MLALSLLNQRATLMIIAFISGIIGVFAFAPYHLYPLAILSLMGILFAWLKSSSPKQGLIRGLLFGIGYFGLGVYWIFISIYEFGHAPLWISVILTALVILFLSLFPALAGYCFTRFYPRFSLRTCILAFPAVWSLSEWVRGWAFTGFPWLTMGDSQTHAFFLGTASIGGTILISFILAHIAGLVVHAIHEKSYLFPTLYLMLLGAGLFSLNKIEWTTRTDKPITVSLVQGNIAQSLKWERGEAENTVETYKKLTENHWDSQLIIWPEAAIPVPIPDSDAWVNELDIQAKKHHTSLLFGVPIESAEIRGIYNGIQAVGITQGQYLKRHLVPFGEFFPMPWLSGRILQQLDIPMSNFQRGKAQQALIQADNTLIASYICYEIAFADEVRGTLGKANVIVAISDDAWFGHSNAQAQQLQMAQMRAMENRRPVLSATNNGLTAIIGADGNINSHLEPFATGVLSAQIQPLSGITFWSKHGMDTVLLLSLISLVCGKSREKLDFSGTIG
jgi:apolipoprotein N-acyltransferase